MKFGISPFGIWRNASTDPAGSATRGLESYDAIYADTRTWVREGWLDYIVPQLYWHIGFDKADYAKLLPWWSTLVKGTEVQLYIGQADYRVGETGPVARPGPARPAARPQRQVRGAAAASTSAPSRSGPTGSARSAATATPTTPPRPCCR